MYEVAGRLKWFFRRGFFGAIALTVVLGAAAACLFPVWRDVLFPTSIGYSPHRSALLTWLVVVNFTVLGVYFVLMGFIAGLRMFRLAAAMEMLFGVLTTFAAACAIYFYPFATALLLIHFVSVLVCFLLGPIMLYVAVNRILQTEFSDAAIDGFEPAGDLKAVLVQLGRFGFVGLVGATAWQVVTFVSYYLTYKTAGRDAAGEYTVMLRIAQPIYTLALSAWAVIYTHTASAWQKGEHKLATERMDMMFRRVAMMVMLCGWAVIISEPLWSWILGKKYSGAGEYLPGLMLMFAAMSNVLLLMNWGRIFGRQWSVVLAGLAAGVLNVVAYYILRRFGGAGFSSLAAGVGVFAGVVLMT
ncbi:MAG: hypothetical protein PHT84_06525, partial [Candidatus Pacebacteria bacterium]|nr:hypothetical protein [Candidatus Paceibacterota bacterium]